MARYARTAGRARAYWVGWTTEIIGLPGVLGDTGLVEPATWAQWMVTPAPLAYFIVGSGTTFLAMAYWERHEDEWVRRWRLLATFVSTILERRAFHRLPQSGKRAANLLAKQRTVDGAEQVFEEWKAQPDKTDVRIAHGAYSDALYRLGEEERSAEVALEEGWRTADTTESY